MRPRSRNRLSIAASVTVALGALLFAAALLLGVSNTPHRPDTLDDEVGIGNLAIIPNTVVDGNGDGLVDDFRDSFAGGTQIYTFDQDVTINSFIFVDKDTGPAGTATAFDADGDVLATASIPNAGDDPDPDAHAD